MREFHIAKIFLDRAIRQFNGRQPTQINLALGELSELNQEALQEQWLSLTRGTPWEHTLLHIRLIPAEVQCMACFSKYHPMDKKILCPRCGSFGAKILTGEECYLESIATEHD